MLRTHARFDAVLSLMFTEQDTPLSMASLLKKRVENRLGDYRWYPEGDEWVVDRINDEGEQEWMATVHTEAVAERVVWASALLD